MASPIYPGYYPGKPVYRDTRYVPKAQEVKLNALEDFLSRLYQQQSLPRWVYEQELEKIQESLVVKPRDALYSSSDVVAYGAEDLQEEAGASVRISINPKEWLEDPKKTFWKNIVTDPLASITDWDEYRTDAKAIAWGRIIGGQDDIPGLTENPYQLYDNDTSREVQDPREEFYGMKGKTLYEKDTPAKSAVGYMQASANTKARNGAYHAFGSDYVRTYAKEFDYTANHLPAGLSAVAIDNFLSVRDELKRKADIIEKFNKLARVSASLVEDNDKKLQLRITDLGTRKEATGVTRDEKGHLSRKEEAVTDEYRVEFERVFNDTRKAIDNRDLTPAERDEARKLLLLADKIETKIFTRDKNGKLILITDNHKIYTTMKLHGSEFFGGTLINKGVLGDYVDKAGANLSNNQKFVEGLNLKGIDENGNSVYATSKSSRNLYRLRKIIRGDWEWEALGDALTDLSEGKIPYQIVWQRFVIPRIERYTPSFWIKSGVKTAAKNLGLEKLAGRYRDWLDGIQNKYIKGILIGLQTPKEAVKAKIVGLITNLIAGAVAVGTGGIGWFVTQAVKVAARFTVNKVSKFIDGTWKKIKQGEGWDFMADGATHAIKIVGVVVFACAISMVAFLTFISMLMTAFSVEDATKTAVAIDKEIIPEGLRAFGGYTEDNCPTNDVLDLGFENTSTNGPARAGYEIVNDLLRGFWCYWNHNPDYDSEDDPDDLFDELRFFRDPFPPVAEIENCGDCLFWCTWLPIIAYREAGRDFDPQVELLGARNMHDYFKANEIFIDPLENGAVNRIRSGDIAFIRTTSGSGWHTGMVYYVDRDFVMTIHSNAGIKEFPYTVNSNGTIQSALPMQVVGFGRPR